MTPDSQLTIVLTLKDRTPFTFRWMSYANSIRLPFRVLIADGGSDDNVPRQLSDPRSFPDVNYEYVRYAYDREYADYYAKIEDALARVRTPYVVLADNDDFFILSGLREAVRFLADHPDYTACGGQLAPFWVVSSEVGDQTYGTRVQWKSTADAESLTDDTARDRIRHKSLKTQYLTYYHVHRTEALRQHFHTICQANPADLFLFEQLLSFLTVIAGKVRQLETLYVARQFDSPDSSAHLHRGAHGDSLGRMLVPTWSTDFAELLRVTSDALAAQDGITPEDARRCIVQAYRMEVAPALLSDLLDEPTVTLPMCVTAGVVQRLLRVPRDGWLRTAARTVYRRLRWVSADAVHGTELRARPVPYAADAFAPIYAFLTRR